MCITRKVIHAYLNVEEDLVLCKPAEECRLMIVTQQNVEQAVIHKIEIFIFNLNVKS